MSKFSKIAMISGLVAAVIASTSAFAVSKRTWSAGARDVENLIRLMDQDKNGVVSKEEFMQFMGAEFDRLDVDRSGGLTAEELSRSRIYEGTHTSPHR